MTQYITLSEAPVKIKDVLIEGSPYKHITVSDSGEFAVAVLHDGDTSSTHVDIHDQYEIKARRNIIRYENGEENPYVSLDIKTENGSHTITLFGTDVQQLIDVLSVL